jgi:hypothetical protein
MAHLEFGQDRLAQPHPLQAFELAQRSVERSLEARFVAEQAIPLGNIWQAKGLNYFDCFATVLAMCWICFSSAEIAVPASGCCATQRAIAWSVITF